MQSVKLYPLTGLKAIRQNEAGGAWRLFVLAKNIAGVLDHIGRDQLQQAAYELGVTKKNFDRWLDAGRRYDLFTDVQRMTGEWVLILPSHKKAAELFDCKLGRPVTLPIELLFGEQWRAYVFAAWQSSYTGNGKRLVSQKKQAEITGIEPQVQTEYNKQAGVKSSKNYALSNQHQTRFAAEVEYGNRACTFLFWDKDTHQRYIGWRIPNTRIFPLFGTDISNHTPRNMSLFNRTAEQQAHTLKTLRKLSNDGKEVTTKEIYTYSRQSEKGNSLWNHLPI